jgi:hypothetical protein
VDVVKKKGLKRQLELVGKTELPKKFYLIQFVLNLLGDGILKEISTKFFLSLIARLIYFEWRTFIRLSINKLEWEF